MDGGPGPDFMYADDSGIGRPERPGINRLGISQIIDVDNDTFQELRSIRDKVGYTELALTNDSQPNDPYPVDETKEVCIGRAVFRRSKEFRRSVKINETDLARNLASIRDAAKDGRFVIAYLHHHHWATDWLEVPEWVSSVAKQCIDAGRRLLSATVLLFCKGWKSIRNVRYSIALGTSSFMFRPRKAHGVHRKYGRASSVLAHLMMTIT